MKISRQTGMIAAIFLLAMPVALSAQPQQQTGADERDLVPAITQLRHVIGTWDVETDFIDAEGKVQATVDGQYMFHWVVADKIVRGTSELPALKQTSAILFFHRAEANEIEMASVGADGRLWRMIGPEDSETRTTPNEVMPDGSTLMLRFTRHSVEQDAFGSTMELSTDGGKSWRIGNQQRVRRVVSGEN